MRKSALLFPLFFATFGLLSAQGVRVSGTLADTKNDSSLIGVSVFLTAPADSFQRGAATDVQGQFIFGNIPPGSYTLHTDYLGYTDLNLPVQVDTVEVVLGRVKLAEDATALKEVTVTEQQLRVQQLGDTTQYNADAYKTNLNATSEDLITKMPGITVENGVVKAQGEEVKKVTIDGEDFFGDDATATLRNLPAEIVDKIQVFDRLSDQSQFTGFDDGQGQKIINIVTKSGKSNGQFGKIYAGYGTDDRYIAGGSVNIFDGKRRISLIGLANNINQQNFSTQDLLGVIGTGSGRQGGQSSGGGGRGGSAQGGGNRGGGGGGQTSDYLTGQQNGINAINSLGINYSDRWGERMKVSGSYFFNKTNNETESILRRQYFLPEASGALYDETQTGGNRNFNHRANLRLEYMLDSANTLTLTPRASWQDNNTFRQFSGQNRLPDGTASSQTTSDFSSNNKGYTLSGNLLYRHRFAKKGRTISFNAGLNANDRNGDSRQFSRSEFFNGLDTASIIDQQYTTASDGRTWSGDLAYTEPIGAKGALQINYSPSLAQNHSDKITNAQEDDLGNFTQFDTLLSNRFDNDVTKHRGGVSYRLRREKSNFSIGLNYQNVHMESAQRFPFEVSINKTFDNLLPFINFNYKPSKNQNLRLDYRTATNVPNIRQLQNVLDNDNPLLLSIGNPDLKQPYNHTLSARLNFNNPTKATSFMVALFGGYTQDYIGNSTIIATSDTTVLGNIPLLPGAQLARPVNISGYWNTRSLATYSWPVKILKSNFSLNAGYSYARLPSLINGNTNTTDRHNTNGGLVWGSNISEKLDFTLSYSANFNVVRNSVQPALNNNYFYHQLGLRFEWEFWKGLFVNSTVDQSLYNGLQSNIDQSYTLWNAALGYRFLKNEALEIKLSAFDLLNQNRSIFRNVTDTYIEDEQTKVLSQYFLLTLTYNLRNFGTRK